MIYMISRYTVPIICGDAQLVKLARQTDGIIGLFQGKHDVARMWTVYNTLYYTRTGNDKTKLIKSLMANYQGLGLTRPVAATLTAYECPLQANS